MTLATLAYTEHTAHPSSAALWTNSFWIWAICVCVGFMFLGIYESIAPRLGWWMPPEKDRATWQRIVALIFGVLVVPPAVILILQIRGSWEGWLPWPLACVFFVAMLFFAWRARQSCRIAAGVGSVFGKHIAQQGDDLEVMDRANEALERLRESAFLELADSKKERDEARAALVKTAAELVSARQERDKLREGRFPAFKIGFIEAYWNEMLPANEENATLFVLLHIENSAAPSAIRNYKVEVANVNGISIPVDVAFLIDG